MREHAPCGTAPLHIAGSQSSLCRNQNDPLRDRPLPSSFPPPALRVTDSIFSGVHTVRGGGGERGVASSQMSKLHLFSQRTWGEGKESTEDEM